MSFPPRCGAQTPDEPASPFDWWVIAGIGAYGGAVYGAYKVGVPGINALIHLAYGQAPIIPSIGIAAAVAGALIVLGVVAYYLLQPDGCVVPKPRTQAICLSGIVETVTDQTSTAVNILAPFARPPAYAFDVVVKSTYWSYVTQNAQWVNCNRLGAAMLRCLVEDPAACAAKIGAAVGAVAGAVGGIIVGFLAAAAIGSLACGPFALLCLILALIVAAIVAAAITYGGAMVGGWIGGAIGAAGEDPVEEQAKALKAGTIVTVRGEWTRDPTYGFNELFYVTSLGRNGDFPTPPSYTTADADSTPADDCPIAPPVIT